MRPISRSFSFRSVWFAALVLGAACAAPSMAGCASSDESATESDDLTQANNEYASILAEADTELSSCKAEGKCLEAKAIDDELLAKGSADETLGIGDVNALAGPITFQSRFPSLRSISMCSVLKPIARYARPYFFVGGSAKAALVKTLADAGVDLVFDLYNKQAAIFHYHNHGYQNLIGAEVSAYMGYGFGKKANVLDAWSGDFQTAEATVETPYLNISAGGFIFRSPDNSIWGGAAEASFGFNALGPLGSVEVAVSEGFWTPWDKATRAFGQSLYLASNKEAWFYMPSVKKSHMFLQFNNTRGFVFALVQKFGALGFAPAAQAAGLAALRAKGISISRMCP